MATEQDKVKYLMTKLYLSTKINFIVYINPLRQMKIHLRQMLRYYKQWRQLIVKYRKNWWNTQAKKKRIDEFEGYIVHFLLEMCFSVSYGDSDVVLNLLSIFYETDGHFEKIIFATPLRLLELKEYGLEDLDKIVSPWSWREMVENPWSWRRMVENPLTGNMELLDGQIEQRINYFTKHAFKKKLLILRIGEHWLRYKMKTPGPTYGMYQTRKSDSLLFTYPDILSKFLDHGLFANADRHDESVLLMEFLDIWYSGGLDPASSDFAHSNNTIAPEVAVKLLRAIKSVHIVIFRGLVLAYRSQKIDSIPDVLEDILPTLQTRCWGPQKLQHLCRWQIRKQMCDCGQLPDGISFLPIPKPLHQYLE